MSDSKRAGYEADASEGSSTVSSRGCTSSPASPLSFFYVEPVQAQLLQLGLSLHSGRRALAVRQETGAAKARRPS